MEESLSYMNRAEYAKELFINGHACSQAVALAFVDILDISKEQLIKITLPFGGGLGRLRLTCGAMSGIAAVVGLVFAEDNLNKDNKIEVYKIIQELAKEFEEMNGSVVCKELLERSMNSVEIGGMPEDRTSEYYKKRSCSEIVYNAALILENYLIKRGII